MNRAEALTYIPLIRFLYASFTSSDKNSLVVVKTANHSVDIHVSLVQGAWIQKRDLQPSSKATTSQHSGKPSITYQTTTCCKKQQGHLVLVPPDPPVDLHAK